MNKKQFLEELSGLKTKYKWYINDKGHIRAKYRNGEHCPITALIATKKKRMVEVVDAEDYASLVGLDNDVTAAILDAADMHQLSEAGKRFRQKMKAALNLKIKDSYA